MRVRRLAALFVAFALPGAGPGLASCRPPGAPAVAPSRQGAAVKVESHSWTDVSVFAERRGVRTRLGTVVAMRTTTLRLPGWLLGDVPIAFVVDPVGGAAVQVSDAVVVRPGQRVLLTLEQELALSSVGVW